jgi:plasmid maintenance system antidote protein VapI
MSKPTTITDALLKTIAERGQSLYSIAKATGIKSNALGRFVSRKQSLRLDFADRLAEHFGLELAPTKTRKARR